MRVFFSLPDTNSVRQFLQKIQFFIFHILDDHLKKHYLYRFFGLSIFFFFCFYYSNIKRKNKKCNFFPKTSFLTSPKFCTEKHYFGTMWHYLCFQKYPKTLQKWGKQWTKNLDQFLTLDLDQFLTLETPNLGPVFNSTAFIYIYIYIHTMLNKTISDWLAWFWN